mgnify:CR=1 FL=1
MMDPDRVGMGLGPRPAPGRYRTKAQTPGASAEQIAEGAPSTLKAPLPDSPSDPCCDPPLSK